MNFIHLKRTSLGASEAVLATDGAAAQAAQVVVAANLGTQINPPPWQVADRADVVTAQGHAQAAAQACQRAVTARDEALGARVAFPVQGGWAAIARGNQV